MCSFKSDLPDISKTPILSSGADWTAWNWVVLDLLDNLCLSYWHIAITFPPGIPVTSLAQPSFPSTLDDDPTPDQLMQHDAWWRANSTVWRVLRGRLSPAPEALVPLCRDILGNIAVSSWNLYAILVAHYGGGDHGTASEVKDKLRVLYCGTGKDAIPAFNTTWHGALRQLENTPWNFTEFECIQTFVNCLSLTEAFRTLHKHVDFGFSAMPPIFPAFESLAVEVLVINTQQHRLTVLRSNTAPPRCNTVSTLPSSTTSTSAPILSDAPSVMEQPFNNYFHFILVCYCLALLMIL